MNKAKTALPPQFKTWDRSVSSCRTPGKGLCSITIGRKGSFLLSKKLAEQMKLSAGSGVSFHQDGSQEQWYMESDNNGLQLRADPGGRLGFGSAMLRESMEAQFPEGVEHGRALVSEEPVEIAGHVLHRIILSSLKPVISRKA
jgi:hypothetical protein